MPPRGFFPVVGYNPDHRASAGPNSNPNPIADPDPNPDHRPIAGRPPKSIFLQNRSGGTTRFHNQTLLAKTNCNWQMAYVGPSPE